MRRILFVDDDPKEIKRLRKMLRSIRHEWEIESAVSGKEALSFMAKSHFDVVVSNMHMQKMDGVELLDTVMERYPGTVRIILSEDSDKEKSLQSVKSTHQFLKKPCDADTVKYTIERACKLQDLLRNETLIKTVTGIKNLPSPPRLYSLIMQEMRSPDASLKNVGDIISQDIAMTAKILQLINSAYFGLPRRITDPQQATIFLGIDTLKALVLTFHVFSEFSEDAELCEFSLADMLKHSIMVGRLAKEIAKVELDDTKILEEIYIAGILHDIGKLILLKLPEQYREVMKYIKSTGFSFVEAEYNVMKTSHAELGAYLLALWGIPDNIVETVAFHNNPSKLLENILSMSIKSNNNYVGEIKPENSNLKSLSKEKYLKEFTTLTSVHLADAMLVQKDWPTDTTVPTYADMLYLRTLELTDNLSEYLECYNKII
jgi:putative nucleotidyltransferase with HDIG domain